MFAVIHLPNFRLQAALRHRAELRARPVALVDPSLPKPTIVQVNLAAARHGVREGHTPSQAAARCAEIVILSAAPADARTATEVLLQTANSFSPNIEETAPGVCTMELKGLGVQTEEKAQSWAASVAQALAGFDLDCQLGIAVTPNLAWLAARRASPILQVTDTAEFVAGLPLEALDLPLETFSIVTRWGMRTAGQILALGKDRVVESLGEPALELFARLATDSPRPLRLVTPPEEFTEQMDFDHEIETAQPLLFVLRRFVEQISKRLEMIYLVVAELDLRLGLASGATCQKSFTIPQPTGRVETLFRALHTHLETLRTDSPITSVRLGAKPGRADTHQFGLFEVTLRDPNQFAETLARLAVLCGPERAGTPVPEATHRPDAFRLRTPDFGARRVEIKITVKKEGLALRRFRPPIAATMEFREQRPAVIHSRPVTGAITKTRGPFHSSGEWWEASRWAREEWDVQTAGGAIYRVFCSPEGCFVEGVYD
ncbi:MAG TPA: DNA polymerase Y family protein [Verrucomicrobiae bacterium]|nr:DNA polymerase Y family protein [Verrucomicrobiae bacterium]